VNTGAALAAGADAIGKASTKLGGTVETLDVKMKEGAIAFNASVHDAGMRLQVGAEVSGFR